MNVLVFAASGATGRELVRQALAQGHFVTAFVRDPTKFPVKHDCLRVVHGDVADTASVERAVQNQDAAVCALGAASPLKRDPKLVEGVGHILEAMESAGRQRFIYLSFLGVRDGRKQLSCLGRYIVAPVLLRKVVADHEAKEKLIKRSHLSWVIVRPPRLTNGPGLRSAMRTRFAKGQPSRGPRSGC